MSISLPGHLARGVSGDAANRIAGIAAFRHLSYPLAPSPHPPSRIPPSCPFRTCCGVTSFPREVNTGLRQLIWLGHRRLQRRWIRHWSRIVSEPETATVQVPSSHSSTRIHSSTPSLTFSIRPSYLKRQYLPSSSDTSPSLIPLSNMTAQ